MEEIIKKLGEKVKEFISKKEIVEKMDAKLLDYQKIIFEKKEEAEKINEKTSGFYKDVEEEMQENQKLHRELFNKREKEKSKLEKEIFESKEIIIKELKEKQKTIDENRNKNLKNVNVDALKKEKEEIEEELKLNNVTKEEFLEMNPEQQGKVRKAKERYLINKKRLSEIEPTIDLVELLDGKEPKDKFLEINGIISQIDKKFNIEHIQELESLVKNKKEEPEKSLEEEPEKSLEEETKQSSVEEVKKEETKQSSAEEVKKDEPEKNEENKVVEKNASVQSENKVNLNKDNKHIDEPYEELANTLSIRIKEKERIVAWTRDDGEEMEYSLDAIKSEKKGMFKRLDILTFCKDNSRNMLGALALYMKVNPAIIKAMDNNKEDIADYIDCLKNKKQFSFNLVHDLSGLNIFQKLGNEFVDLEEKLGAVVKGKIFSKTKALPEPKKDNKTKSTENYNQAQRDFKKTLKVIKKDREDIKLENELKENLSKEVTEMMDSNKDEANKYSELVNKDYMQSLEDKFNDALKDEDYTR